MATGPGGSSRIGGSLTRLYQEILDYLICIQEIDEDVKLTGIGIEPEYPPAPPLLILYQRLEAWNALPIHGGFFDQPCQLMMALETVRTAIAEWRHIDQINQLSKISNEPVIGEEIKTQSLPGLNF